MRINVSCADTPSLYVTQAQWQPIVQPASVLLVTQPVGAILAPPVPKVAPGAFIPVTVLRGTLQ